MDIPAMLRAIAEGDAAKAAEIVRRDIAIPAVLGTHLPRSLREGSAAEGTLDAAVSICGLKRFAADATLDEDLGRSGVPRRPASRLP